MSSEYSCSLKNIRSCEAVKEILIRLSPNNNAYFTYEEDIKGSLEPGKLADFLVLSDDIMMLPEEQILEIRPRATYVSDRKVCSAPQGGC